MKGTLGANMRTYNKSSSVLKMYVKEITCLHWIIILCKQDSSHKLFSFLHRNLVHTSSYLSFRGSGMNRIEFNKF